MVTYPMSSPNKKGFFAEFKTFISRGNVLDMAVGIIVGTAFTKIVNSLVNDLLMPSIGWLIGGIDFSSLKIVIKEASGDTAETAICYGSFIQAVVDFLLIALTVFIMVRVINRFHELLKKREAELRAAENAVIEEAKEEAKADELSKPPEEVLLLTEIRDLLKSGGSKAD